jgi:error-prone DNA polymerase
VREREHAVFSCLDDFKLRVPMSKEELRTLALIGAFNCFSEHRRSAMWQAEEARYNDLLRSARFQPARSGILPEDPGRQDAARCRQDACAPLQRMTIEERVNADYTGMNLTTGPHPMQLVRGSLPNVWRAIDLAKARHGSIVQIAGNVICRQRPGTAKGFVFVSLEDETGISNAIVTPDLFEKLRLVLTEEPFLLIEGQVQNTDNVVLVKAQHVTPLAHEQLAGSDSHDFR